jgi:hypothetical protein
MPMLVTIISCFPKKQSDAGLMSYPSFGGYCSLVVGGRYHEAADSLMPPMTSALLTLQV